MAKIKDITPEPQTRTFELTLTNKEISENTETATRLWLNRWKVANALELNPNQKVRFEKMIGLILAMDPDDPLDEVDDVDDEFLFLVGGVRQ